jgi:hypothetical protein
MKIYFQYILIITIISANISILSSQNLGDTITVSGAKYKLKSVNLITNPGFENDFTGWTDATTSAATLTSANFTIMTTGGIGNSKYLVGNKNESSNSAGSIGTGWSISAGKKYYFSYYIKYQNTSTAAGNEEWSKISLTNNKTSNLEPLILLNFAKVNGAGAWTQNEIIFTNSNPAYSYIVARFRWLGGRLGYDNFALFEVEDVVNISDLQAVIGEAQSIYKPETTGAVEFLAAIQTAQSFLNSQSATDVQKAINDLKKAIFTYKLKNATPQNPLDMTNMITNPAFNNNTPGGWKGIGTINYHVVEFYQRTFNMHQKIAGLPSGKYVLKAQGFERPKANDGGAAYRAGTEQISAVFYAKTNSFPQKNSLFKSIYQQTYTGSGSLGGYVNTMAAAETLLANANRFYDVTVSEILLNAGDTLTIGARSDFQQSGYWALFDNFRLEYHGSFDTLDLKNSLLHQVEIAEEQLTKKIQNTVRASLNSSITESQKALNTVPLDFSKLSTANYLINTAIDNSRTSVATFNMLQGLINEAEQISGSLSVAKQQSLATVLTTARNLVDDLDATTSALNKSIADISSLIFKKIYVPTWMLGNVNLENNTWSMSRSKQSRNWIVFWEPGYGEDPSVLADGNYRINIDELLRVAEMSFDFYTDSLKFIKRGNSKTDNYKMIIRLRYTRDWEATGSGVDDLIGLLTLTAWSAQVGGHTLAHEVGHCFQYQTHCDNNNQNGWMYGFGANASGGNGWWEQCAQWQAFKVYPAQQFTDGRFTNYLNTAHKHILHEAPRYDNYFIQDFWTYKHGMDFIGKLWNQSVKPEDPVEAYKRITKITQAQFNDEMYEHAARFTTWDIPALISAGTSRISSRPQTKMNNAGDNYWIVDASVCPENYGYNAIKINAPTKATTVSAYFEGKAGMDGFRKNYVTSAGWRYGFVALLTNNTRVYSETGSASYNITKDTLHFNVPDNCKQLWLVVSGAPSVHWRHAWDDDDSNDEQWPYQVKFNNTNLLGYQNVVNIVKPDFADNILIYNLDNKLHIKYLPYNSNVKIYNSSGICILHEKPENDGMTISLPNGIYIINIYDNKNSYNHKVVVK